MSSPGSTSSSSYTADVSTQGTRKRRLVDTTGASPHSVSYSRSSDSASHVTVSSADAGIEILPVDANNKFIRLYNNTDKVILHRGAILRFFCPRGATRCTDGVKFGVEEFHPIVAGVGCGPQNWKFYQILEYKRSPGACPLGNFYQIFNICGQLYGRSGVKIWTDSLNGLQSYGGLNVGCIFTQIFSTRSAKNFGKMAMAIFGGLPEGQRNKLVGTKFGR